jgi:GT2 family glycosyltransferase
VIVIDNGSSDGSQELVKQHITKGLQNLSLIENPENRGFCAANNQGIRAARGACIALLNNDAEAEPDWLAELERTLRSGEKVGMAASKILVWEDPGRIDKAGHLIYPDGQNRGRGSGQPDRGQFDQEEEVLWPDGCAAMYRREMLLELGGFDEDFFAYADDAELGLRARIAGWKCLYNPKAVVRHHRGATLGLSSTFRLELIERNRILLAVKLFPASLLWKNGAYFLARLTAGLWAAIRGKGESRRYPGLSGKLRIAAALLRGQMRALVLLPAMLRKRREVARIRKLTPREVKLLLLRHRISLKEISEQAI